MLKLTVVALITALFSLTGEAQPPVRRVPPAPVVPKERNQRVTDLIYFSNLCQKYTRKSGGDGKTDFGSWYSVNCNRNMTEVLEAMAIKDFPLGMFQDSDEDGMIDFYVVTTRPDGTSDVTHPPVDPILFDRAVMYLAKKNSLEYLLNQDALEFSGCPAVEAKSVVANSLFSSATKTENGLVTRQFLAKIDLVLTGTDSTCARKSEAVIRLLTDFRTSNLEDLIWVNWITKNVDAVLRDPLLRRLITMAVHFEAFHVAHVTHEDYWTESLPIKEPIFVAYEIKKAIQGIHLGILEKYGAKSYGDFPALANNKKTLVEILSKSFDEIEKVMKDKSYRDKNSKSFGLMCDQRVTKVFGGVGNIGAAAAGVERYVGPGGVSYGNNDFHYIANAHIYTNPAGGEVHGPLFVPPGWTASSEGSGANEATKGYNLNYSKGLGSHKGPMTLIICHMSDPQIFRRYPRTPTDPGTFETNPSGSIRIGTTGGAGGVDAPPNEGDGNAHSHLFFFHGKNTNDRLSFMDVFCK